MAKNYSVFAKAYAGVIKRGRRQIEDVRPDELKEDVIEILASEGLGSDGKPLINNKVLVGPKGEPGEPGIASENRFVPESENSGDTKEGEKPKKTVEDKKEDEPNKDTKEKENEGAN